MFDGRHLYLLFTPSLCPRDPWDTLEAALRGGVDLVQWRTPGETDRDGAARCVEHCSAHDVPVVINDDVELAVELSAFGTHVGQGDTPPTEARRMLRDEQCLGVSTHSLEELDRALRDGADHVGFGPMFATTTKGYAEGQPEGALRQILARASVPVFPIGGITLGGLPRLRSEGTDRAAVSSAILTAADPQSAAAEIRAALVAD